MDDLLIRSILFALFIWATFFDKYCTQLFTYRPIVVGPIVGLIFGNLRVGLEVGTIVELMFLGQVFVGTALPPEETFSTAVATAFACISGNTSVALATALPLAILGQMAMYFRNMVLCVWTQNRLEVAVEKMNRRGFWTNCLIIPNLYNLVLFAVPAFLAVYFGADVVQAIINAIPTVIMDGITVGGKMIGAVGLALLIKSINTKNIWHYFAVGFFFSSYLKINPIGITLIAVICVAAAIYNDKALENATGQ